MTIVLWLYKRTSLFSEAKGKIMQFNFRQLREITITIACMYTEKQNDKNNCGKLLKISGSVLFGTKTDEPRGYYD